MNIKFCTFFMLIGLSSINPNENLNASDCAPVFRQQVTAQQLTLPTLPSRRLSQHQPQDSECFTEEKEPEILMTIGQTNGDSEITKFSEIIINNSLKIDHRNMSKSLSHKNQEVGLSKVYTEIETFAFFPPIFEEYESNDEEAPTFDRTFRVHSDEGPKKNESHFNSLSHRSIDDIINNSGENESSSFFEETPTLNINVTPNQLDSSQTLLQLQSQTSIDYQLKTIRNKVLNQKQVGGKRPKNSFFKKICSYLCPKRQKAE